MTADQIDAGFRTYLSVMALAFALAVGLTHLRRRRAGHGAKPRLGLMPHAFAQYGLALFGIGWTGLHHLLGMPSPGGGLSLLTLGMGLAVAAGRRLRPAASGAARLPATGRSRGPACRRTSPHRS